jgi:PAS domain S-box-containing protein
MRTDFLSLIVEEDRQAVEEKISRLISGVTDVETEIHRVIQPDGSIGWQEWTDQAIRDETGQVIEFQSVGRDVTERKQAEEALRESEERFAILSTATFEAIGLSEQGKIIDVNEQMLEMFGYTRSEMIGMNVEQLVAPEAIELVIRNISLGLEQAYEHLAVKKDGTLFPVEVRPRTIPYKGRTVRVTAISDITERKKAEARILRLNRLYATISQINQTIVHARDRSSLFSEICRVAIDHGQFRMAWIGLLDETDELIKPIIFAGEEQGYLSNLEITFRDEIMGWGPTGTAVREGRCVICQDIDSDPRMIPWREHALKHGYRSSAAVPFREQGQVVGALTVYAGEPQGFDSEDEGLLEQIGRNLSFALDSIDADVERKRAEENLAEAYDTTLEGWAKALELRDKETEGHSRRVTETTLIVARAMGFKEEELVDIRRGSILHDIGKMGIPDEILRKKGRLTNEERTIVEKHPNTAFDLLKQIPYLKKSLEIPYCHHEKWDGTGYPRGLKGDEIPLSARIFAIVDVWDALSSDRPYREAWSQDNVTQYLLNESGKHFDPNIVEVFLQLLREGKI